jgi:crotonobetainyl-CoA:carnitine CoA-transferase CaiB-like acyl-CoA transferase
VRDGGQIFLAAVSDPQWLTFCDALGFADLKADASLATNNQRVRARPTLIPLLRERLANRTADDLADLFERVGLPYAPIRRPEDLFDDPHLNATGGLADIRLPDGERAGQSVRTTLFPITLQGQRLGVRLDPPRISEHMRESLRSVGYSDDAIDHLVAQGAVAASHAVENPHPEGGATHADERLEQADITASP